MKTIESLSTSELENWMNGNAPSGNIIELERAAVQYACRVELQSRPGGCNRADRPTHEAELILGDKEEEIEELKKEVEDLRKDARDADDALSEAEDDIEELEEKIEELEAKLIGKE